ncbi:MAG: S-layer homology domain-containing protein, partial [Oscillospiraceae bacterium]|nr:S-layer homology domain-containing protein [Oscillospiraceae bacterium]
APTMDCNRAQVVTFLWRAMGKPGHSATESEFTDVTNPGAFYYDAVLWASENEITTGMKDGTFGVAGTCTRGQVVTFLYRAMGK